MKTTRINPLTNKQVGAYLSGMVALVLIAHVALVLQDSVINATSALALVPAALLYAFFITRYKAAIAMRPYASYLLHVATYFIVTGSYWLHAFILSIDGNFDIATNGWSGVLYGMSLIWGIGLLLHTVGALLSRGYETASIE